MSSHAVLIDEISRLIREKSAAALVLERLIADLSKPEAAKIFNTKPYLTKAREALALLKKED